MLSVLYKVLWTRPEAERHKVAFSYSFLLFYIIVLKGLIDTTVNFVYVFNIECTSSSQWSEI